MSLIRLLKDQKQELEDDLRTKRIIRREAERSVSPTKLIRVVSGVRRCGKSVFIQLLLDKRNFAYMNFDDDRLPSFTTSDILSSFYKIYGKDLKVIFLDEIQNLNKWELFANRLSRTGFDLYITGSNANLLSKELATHLTGRHITAELFPFSFREYLMAKDFKEDVETTRGESLMRRELNSYLQEGGFPEIVVQREDPKKYLMELYRNILERDIITRHRIAYQKTFREIAISLLSNPGRSISCNSIKKKFSIGSEHTVKNYLSYMEEAYMILLLNRFSFKPAEVEKSNKKVYTIDPGMISSLSIRSSHDYGHIYENVVALELFRRKSYDPLEIYYWKNVRHEEVDFVIRERLKINRLIQVCYDLEDYNTKQREVKALIKASKELKCRNLLVITDDYEAEEKEGNRTVKYLPLWKFLLQPILHCQ